MIVGIVGLTGCSSDTKTEDLKNNLQPEGSVQVDSQNQVEPQIEKEKWVFLDNYKEKGIVIYYNANHIETIESDGSTQNHKKITLKGLSTDKKDKNKEVYMDVELDCAGKTRTIETRMFKNGKLLWTKNTGDGYGEWEVINPNADGPEALTESKLCSKE